MRHWNLGVYVSVLLNSHHFYPTYEALKLDQGYTVTGALERFLPYLWGIETRALCLALAGLFYYFYPTYEALKLVPASMQMDVEEHFYPTYEALKHVLPVHLNNAVVDFYPTYEALKHSFLPGSTGSGMFDFYPTYEALKQ